MFFLKIYSFNCVTKIGVLFFLTISCQTVHAVLGRVGVWFSVLRVMCVSTINIELYLRHIPRAKHFKDTWFCVCSSWMGSNCDVASFWNHDKRALSETVIRVVCCHTRTCSSWVSHSCGFPPFALLLPCCLCRSSAGKRGKRRILETYLSAEETQASSLGFRPHMHRGATWKFHFCHVTCLVFF